MVLNELLLNAVEHGFEARVSGEPGGAPGEVVVGVHRYRKQLHVIVSDNGRGLPEGFDPGNSQRLGLQIVRTLATGELRGTIELRTRAEGGTEAVLAIPLRREK